MLDISHLAWSPEGEGVIRDIDLHVDDGKMVVVTGPNGGFIFLPANGYFFGSQIYDTDETGNYWTSTGYDNGNFSYALDFSKSRPKIASSGRSGGRCIRPVYVK